MRDFEPFEFAQAGAPGPSGRLAREVSDLLVPAVTKASIDLWISTAGLCTSSYVENAYGTSSKADPYEVTIVQALFEILAAQKELGTPVWEAGFKKDRGRGAPKRIDLVLEDSQSTPTSKIALFEFGVDFSSFDSSKIGDDLEKLRDLQLEGVAVTGFKQVFFITIVGSKTANVYKHAKREARAANPDAYMVSRCFPLFSPGGWRYATVAVYE